MTVDPIGLVVSLARTERLGSASHGPELFRGGLKVWWEALPDLYPTIDQLIAEDDRVVILCTFTGTRRGDLPTGPSGPIRATGKRLNLPIIYVFRISDARVVEAWESRNDGSLWQQLGGIPAPRETAS